MFSLVTNTNAHYNSVLPIFFKYKNLDRTYSMLFTKSEQTNVSEEIVFYLCCRLLVDTWCPDCNHVILFNKVEKKVTPSVGFQTSMHVQYLALSMRTSSGFTTYADCRLYVRFLKCVSLAFPLGWFRAWKILVGVLGELPAQRYGFWVTCMLCNRRYFYFTAKRGLRYTCIIFVLTMDVFTDAWNLR